MFFGRSHAYPLSLPKIMYGLYPSLILPVLLKEYLMLHANEGHDVAVVVVVVVAKVSLVEVQLKVHVDLEVVIVSLGILGGEVLLEEPKMSNIKVKISKKMNTYF